MSLCKLFGHKWDKSDLYTQPCKRLGCKITRVLLLTNHKSNGYIEHVYIKKKKK